MIEHRDHYPECGICKFNDEVTPDYGLVDDDSNLPPEIEFDHKTPFSCFRCGNWWFGHWAG